MSAEAQAKRMAMAATFANTQRQMSDRCDEVAQWRRSAVPYPSTWTGTSVADTGPIPTDNHLIPSNFIVFKAEPTKFKPDDSKGGDALHLGGLPWASYTTPQPEVFSGPPAETAPPPPGPPAPVYDQELQRARGMEWTLQKNAFNPDIAAAMRTNVRKMAAMSTMVPGQAQDPARTSENVKAALTHSDVTGPAYVKPKAKLGLANALPLTKG